MAESEFGLLARTGADRGHASYGKACLNCARSKTRCATSSTGGTCERCLRLGKECQPSPTVRKKRAAKRPSPSVAAVANKTAVLEEKLDGIVQLLQRSQPPQTQANSPTSAHDITPSLGQTQYENSTVLNNRLAASSNPDALLQAAQNQRGMNHAISGQPPTPATSCSSIATDMCYWPTHTLSSTPDDYPLEGEDECEKYLETYRSKMSAFFPVVLIRPEVTVQELREQRPFLWLVIRAICSKNSTRQRALGIEIRKTLGKEMLLESVRSLDLFLGILVFAGWGHYYVSNKPFITTLIQLAISLASDLGLTKPVPVGPTGVMMNYSAQGCPKPPASYQLAPRTMEERRAMIGLFLVSSIVSNYFQRIDQMQWTPYLDECLRLLAESKDCATDNLLVYLVQVQLICNRVATVTWTDNTTVGDGDKRLPAEFYVQTFKSQLEEVKRTIPSELKTNAILQLHILNTTISIHEHSLIVSPSRDDAFNPTAIVQRTENLWTCLTATRSFFNLIFSLNSFPVSCYPQMSMAIFSQLAHCMVALFRLSTFECPGVQWDRQRVRQELDLREILRLWQERWQMVPAAAGLDADLTSDKDEGPWVYTHRTLLVIGKWWEARVACMIAAERQSDAGQGVEGNGTAEGFGMPQQHQIEAMDFTAMNLDGWDDTWMRDMLGGGYDYFKEPYF